MKKEEALSTNHSQRKRKRKREREAKVLEKTTTKRMREMRATYESRVHRRHLALCIGVAVEHDHVKIHGVVVAQPNARPSAFWNTNE